MYFFRKKSASGTTLQLLESYRNGNGQPRTRVVVSLGDAAIEPELWPELATEVEARLYNQPRFWAPGVKVAEQADRIVKLVHERGRWATLPAVPGEAVVRSVIGILSLPRTVDGVILDQVETADSVSLGPELVGLHAWQQLQFDGLLETLGFNEMQRKAACQQVVGRLIDPGSELALSCQVMPRSALPELLGMGGDTPTSSDRLYRVGDKLLAHRDAIETHLRRTVAQRLSLTRTYYLYDLTNTHFEGICAANPKAKRGKSKQKRSDCPLVAAGVCFDEFGFVLHHRTFAGNIGEASTLKGMIDCMQADMGEEDLFQARPTVVVDGGLATDKNLAFLREADIPYLVNRTRSHRKRYESQLAEVEKFTEVPGRADGNRVLVRKMSITDIQGAKGTEAADGSDADLHSADDVVLCRSYSRGNKESAIRSRAEERMLTDLTKLHKRVQSGKLKDPAKIERAIGRLAARHSRCARYYRIAMVAGVLTWPRLDDMVTAATELDGTYVLQASHTSYSAVELWQHYMVLTVAESGFRCFKSHLGLRPNFHQLERRVDAHIFITVLAYQLMRFVLFQLEQIGDNRSWPTIRRILEAHRYCSIIMPTTAGVTWTLRKAGLPDAAHRAIYSPLGIDYAAVPSKSTAVAPVAALPEVNRNV